LRGINFYEQILNSIKKSSPEPKRRNPHDRYRQGYFWKRRQD